MDFQVILFVLLVTAPISTFCASLACVVFSLVRFRNDYREKRTRYMVLSACAIYAISGVAAIPSLFNMGSFSLAKLVIAAAVALLLGGATVAFWSKSASGNRLGIASIFAVISYTMALWVGRNIHL